MDVARKLSDSSCSRSGIASAAQLRTAGVSRSSLSRARCDNQVVRVHPGVYGVTELAPWPTYLVTSTGVAPAFVQRVRAALLSLGETATAGGLTAACLRGWGVLNEPLRVLEMMVPRGRSRARLAGVRVMQRRHLDRTAWVPLAGQEAIWVTSAVTTVLDCIRSLKLDEAVVVCDSALRSGQVTMTELREAARHLRGHRHAARARRVLDLADPQCGSVLESVLRVLLVQAGLTDFSTQRVILDASGKRILRVDFCFGSHGLVIEADGSRWHPDPLRDRKLDNRLVAAGWRVLRFTWSEVVHDPAAVLELVRAAVAAGSQDCQDAAVQAGAAA